MDIRRCVASATYITRCVTSFVRHSANKKQSTGGVIQTQKTIESHNNNNCASQNSAVFSSQSKFNARVSNNTYQVSDESAGPHTIKNVNLLHIYILKTVFRQIFIHNWQFGRKNVKVRTLKRQTVHAIRRHPRSRTATHKQESRHSK